MKTTKLLLSCLLMVGATTQMSMAEEKVAKGTTLGFKHCMKPGAPVDITYTTTKVKVDEVSEVNIILTTTLQSGEMEVTINLDEALTQIDEPLESIKFMISAVQKEYPIRMKVSAKKDGLYYVRLLTKIDSGNGARMRAMAVPIYVGDGKLKQKSRQVIMKAMGGENISVSKAEETITFIEN